MSQPAYPNHSSRVRISCALMLAVYSSGCAFFSTKALPSGYRAETAPPCTTDAGPARTDLIVAGVFTGFALIATAQAVGAAPGDQKAASSAIPGLLLLAAPFGASAGVGYHRVAQCQEAQSAWAVAEAKREKERQERLAAQARAEEERRAAQKRAEEEARIAAQKRAEEERLAAEKRAEEERLAAEKRVEEEQLTAQAAPAETATEVAPSAPAPTGPIAADGTPMLLADRTANPAYFNPPKGYRSPEGYQKARWGMTEAEVKQVYPQARAMDQGLWFEGETAGHKAVTAFGFSEHRLGYVGIRFDITRSTVAQYIEDYEALKKLLVQKYGTPKHDDVNWREGKEFLSDAPDGLSTALRLGYATLETQWTTGETMIRLECEAKRYTPTISITYASLRLMQRMVEKENQAKADDL